LGLVAAIAPELMTFPLAATPSGHVAEGSLAPEFEGNADSKRGGPSLVSQAFVDALTAGKTVMAIGPGLGQGRRQPDSPLRCCGDEDAGGD